MKELETRVVSLPLALTLFMYAEGFKPSAKRGEGLQSGSPSPFLGEGDEGKPAQKCPNYCKEIVEGIIESIVE